MTQIMFELGYSEKSGRHTHAITRTAPGGRMKTCEVLFPRYHKHSMILHDVHTPLNPRKGRTSPWLIRGLKLQCIKKEIART